MVIGTNTSFMRYTENLIAHWLCVELSFLHFTENIYLFNKVVKDNCKMIL